MNDVGLEADWRILRGTPDFFEITKKFHNALQGDSINLTEIKRQIYVQNNEDFSRYCHINSDFVLIHDNQPLPMIGFLKCKEPWIWRCHVDLSGPNDELFEYLKNFILRYDLIIISNEKYRNKDLPVDHRIIPPAIDPLSSKNMELPNHAAAKYLKKYGIPKDKPLITQISRFDKWKDPEGVIDVFRLVKKETDCRLVLCGSMATDDPEGTQMVERIQKKARDLLKKRDVILITAENNILVNILQRSSEVIVQKSIKEGFGLTVAEALWKEKPVVASNVGGISLQIRDGENGFVVGPYDNEQFAEKILTVLRDRDLAEKIGKEGRRTVKEKYLITRLILDYLDVLDSLSR